jgi:phosphoenolpyruvate synthase/pyruvate phosphate dikinase
MATDHSPTLGGKSRSLVAVTGSGLPVLPGFAIPVELESAILDAYGELGDRLGTTMPRVTVAGAR